MNLEPGTQLADWARRKKGLVALAVILVCWITGWVWVVVLDRPAGVIDGSRVGHFPALIVLGGFLLFLGVWGAYLAAHALAAVTVLVVGVLKTPVRIGRWVATNGVRGMAGHGVRVVAIALGVAPLFFFSRLTGVSSFDLQGSPWWWGCLPSWVGWSAQRRWRQSSISPPCGRAGPGASSNASYPWARVWGLSLAHMRTGTSCCWCL